MTDLKIKPLADRVLIEPIVVENKTASGIFIPDMAVEKPKEGTIVAIGEETKWVIKGDKVIYNKNAGMDVEEGGVHYLLMKEIDVLAII